MVIERNGFTYYLPVLWEGDITQENVVDVIRHYAEQEGYLKNGWSWQGPLFKPENSYMTLEDYPLGTTGWYVKIEIGGMCPKLPRDTFLEAVQAAHQYIVKEIEELKAEFRN